MRSSSVPALEASRARASGSRSREALRSRSEIPGAGVSTLAALGASERGVYPVIDARRREVFVDGPRAVSPDDLDLEPGTVCVGSGAIRYRSTFERMGAVVPPDDDTMHVPHARLHASLVTGFGPVDAIEPIYVRVPDAEATLA